MDKPIIGSAATGPAPGEEEGVSGSTGEYKSSSSQGVMKVEAANQKELVRNTEAMFKSISEYVQGELLVTSGDYKLLEQMNHVTTEKYKAMTDQATDLVLFMEELQKKYLSFQPYLQQIDSIEKNVDELERTVMLMDEYTRQLEGKFRLLNEREKAALVAQVKAKAPSTPVKRNTEERKDL